MLFVDNKIKIMQKSAVNVLLHKYIRRIFKFVFKCVVKGVIEPVP